MLARNAADPNSHLYRALKRARVLWWRMTLRLALAIAVAVASVAVASTWVIAWLSGQQGSLSAGLGLEWSVALVAGVVLTTSFVLAVAVQVLRSPSLLELARRADHRLGLSQRLSTAWEVWQRDDARNVVTDSLIADAEKTASSLDLRQLTDRAGRGWVVAVVAGTVVLAGIASLVPVPARAPRAPTQSAATPPTTARLGEDVATLDAVARLLDLAADREDSPYLRAVASSFSELSTRMSAGTATAEETESALRDLVGHLEAAAAEAGGAFGRAVESALSGAAGPARPSGGSTRGLTPDGASPETLASEPGAAGVDAEAPDNEAYVEALRDLVNQFENDPDGLDLEPRSAAAGQQADDASFYGGVLRAETDPNAAAQSMPAPQRVQAEGGGDAAGAAERSSEGAGDAAGAGGAELAGQFETPEPLEPGADREALLPRNESEGGRYVEVEMVPQAVDATAGDTPGGVVRAFERSAEAAVTIRGVSAAYQDVISSYFTPDSSTLGGGQQDSRDTR